MFDTPKTRLMRLVEWLVHHVPRYRPIFDPNVEGSEVKLGIKRWCYLCASMEDPLNYSVTSYSLRIELFKVRLCMDQHLYDDDYENPYGAGGWKLTRLNRSYYPFAKGVWK